MVLNELCIVAHVIFYRARLTVSYAFFLHAALLTFASSIEEEEFLQASASQQD